MPKKIAIMGLFTEVGATADALEGLRLLGLREEDMSIIQGVPYTSKMLGRPHLHEFPWFSILGALGGFATALFLTWGTLLALSDPRGRPADPHDPGVARALV